MGYWENTAYIKSDSTKKIADKLVQLMESEGMRHIARPFQRERVLYEPMQYDNALRNNTWGLAVFPGVPGWNVIKTAPLDLLAERASGRDRMRFVELCTALGSPGFLVGVYDSSSMVLVETDGTGRYLLSGLAYNDPFHFYKEPLNEEWYEVRFDILDLQKLVEASHYLGSDLVDNKMLCKHLSKSLGGDNAEFCNNITSVNTLVCHEPLMAAGGIDLYFIWPANDRLESPRMKSWEEWREWNKGYS